MKTFFRLTVIFIITILYGNLYAQAVETLYFTPSPFETGMGMTGTALPTDDPAGFFYNPAQLGYISQTNNISLQLYPSGVNWIPKYLNNYKYENTSFSAGYNFNKLLNGLNLSAGFGYIHSRFDLGSFNVTGPDSPTPIYSIGEYNQFDAYSFGIGLDYYVQFNIGITYKKIYSQVAGSSGFGEFKPYSANVSATDFGFLLVVPVKKIICPEMQYQFADNLAAAPYLNFSLGYAKLNVGDEVTYADPAQADPLPRSARLGYAFSAGINMKLNNSKIKALGYDFTVDVDDYLFETNSSGTNSYQGFLGDIKIGKNLFELKSDDNVVVHKGHNISLFETVSFQIGRFDGRGYSNYKSSGFGLETKGLFTILKPFTSNSILNLIADHLNIKYYNAKLFADSPIETKFEGINIIWYGMTF